MAITASPGKNAADNEHNSGFTKTQLCKILAVGIEGDDGDDEEEMRRREGSTSLEDLRTVVVS